MLRRPPRSPLFPSATLSRSLLAQVGQAPLELRHFFVDLVEPLPGMFFSLFRELARGELELRQPPLGLVNRSEEHTSELQSRQYIVCRLLLEKKKLRMTTDQR